MFTQETSFVPVPGGEVFVRTLTPNNADNAKHPPLIFIHGGPGGYHDNMHHYTQDLAEYFPVIYYDQLGCHSSPAELNQTHYKIDRFTEELHCIINAGNIDKAIVLGHSWGACIATEYALKYNTHITGFILSSPLISTSHWISDAKELLKQLPQETQDTINHHEQNGTTNDPAYDTAVKEFNKRFVCRMDPLPDIVKANFSKTNKKIYNDMWGPSEFTCNGTLKNYNRFDDLKNISAPALLMGGRYDEARPETLAQAAKTMPNAQTHIFENSAHMAYFEEDTAYTSTILNFINGAIS